jgi:hypothetical protein
MDTRPNVTRKEQHSRARTAPKSGQVICKPAGFVNLPDLIQARIPRIGKGDTLVIMHNDAVVQGLSEIPRMKTSGNGVFSPLALDWATRPLPRGR